MDVKFSGYQVLEIAEQIEQNGSRFYTEAAELFDDPQLHDLFARLAEWETTHKKLFAQMRKQFAEQLDDLGTFDPDIYMANPRLMASLTVFAIGADADRQITGTETPELALKKAIKNEKDTITFYEGLKGFARNSACAGTLDEIIEEEKRHIKILTQSLQQR